MANSQKNNKKLIIGICSIVAVVAIIAVIVIIITMRGGFGPAINDNYFVTDNSKYVITLDEKQTDEDINAEKTHIVYNYSGNNITSVKYYPIASLILVKPPRISFFVSSGVRKNRMIIPISDTMIPIA